MKIKAIKREEKKNKLRRNKMSGASVRRLARLIEQKIGKNVK